MLCNAASHGNELAFSELYRRHYPSLRAFVFHLLGARHRHEDSEDVVQDAFARAFDAICERRFSGDFRRWVFTIARNRSIDLLRGERVRLISLETSGVEAGMQAAAESTTPATVAETRDEVAWLVAAIDELPERQRSALLLRELAGLSHSEIAETLDTTAGSARQLITRARDGVRNAAERDGRDHENRKSKSKSKSKSLRSDLLDATPMLPLAAAGVAVSTGTTVGGSMAVGKIAATVLAAMVLAGSAGQVGREVANAGTAPSSSSAPDQAPAKASGSSSNNDRGRVDEQKRAGPEPRSESKFAADAQPKRDSHAAPADARPHDVQSNSSGDDAEIDKGISVDAPADVAPEPAQPVKEVVELPIEIVEQVTETLGEVTTGLLGPGSR